MDLESKMHQSDTIQDQAITEILLRSFKSQENNEQLKSKYLSWLNDKENTRFRFEPGFLQVFEGNKMIRNKNIAKHCKLEQKHSKTYRT